MTTQQEARGWDLESGEQKTTPSKRKSNNSQKEKRQDEKQMDQQRSRTMNPVNFAAARFPASSFCFDFFRCGVHIGSLAAAQKPSKHSYPTAFASKLRHPPIGEWSLQLSCRVYAEPLFCTLCAPTNVLCRILGCTPTSSDPGTDQSSDHGSAESWAIYFAGPDSPALRHSLLTSPSFFHQTQYAHTFSLFFSSGESKKTVCALAI